MSSKLDDTIENTPVLIYSQTSLRIRNDRSFTILLWRLIMNDFLDNIFQWIGFLVFIGIVISIITLTLITWNLGLEAYAPLNKLWKLHNKIILLERELAKTTEANEAKNWLHWKGFDDYVFHWIKRKQAVVIERRIKRLVDSYEALYTKASNDSFLTDILLPPHHDLALSPNDLKKV